MKVALNIQEKFHAAFDRFKHEADGPNGGDAVKGSSADIGKRRTTTQTTKRKGPAWY